MAQNKSALRGEKRSLEKGLDLQTQFKNAIRLIINFQCDSCFDACLD